MAFATRAEHTHRTVKRSSHGSLVDTEASTHVTHRSGDSDRAAVLVDRTTGTEAEEARIPACAIKTDVTDTGHRDALLHQLLGQCDSVDITLIDLVEEILRRDLTEDRKGELDVLLRQIETHLLRIDPRKDEHRRDVQPVLRQLGREPRALLQQRKQLQTRETDRLVRRIGRQEERTRAKRRATV